jgi:hypothetical protein
VFQSANHSFQGFDPLADANRFTSHVGDQMDVIRHDDEPAAKPPVTGRAVEKECHKPIEDRIVIQNSFPAIHAKVQETRTVSIAIRPHAMQTAETARGRFSGCRSCDVRIHASAG